MQLTPSSPKSAVSPPSAPSSGPLRLPSSLDMTCADSLLASLQIQISHDEALLIDGSDVERVSTPCVQLLVAAAASAQRRGLSFRMAEASAVLRTAIADLGLGDALGMHAADGEAE